MYFVAFVLHPCQINKQKNTIKILLQSAEGNLDVRNHIDMPEISCTAHSAGLGRHQTLQIRFLSMAVSRIKLNTVIALFRLCSGL